MPLSPTQFVERWRIASLSERASSQSHFLDLCEMLGEPHPVASDAVGERFTFEKRVSKTSGGKGFADVWLRDHFAWEYKGKLKDLNTAYLQLLDYREDLLNPPLLVVCDLNRFDIHTNFGKSKKRIYSFDLNDLERNQITASCPHPPLEVLRALFHDTDRLRPERTDAFVTQEAAKVFALMAERLEIEKRALTEIPIATKQEIAHFLLRLLFCLFADNIGLLPEHVFRRMVDSDDRFSPRLFIRKLRILFEAMSEPDGVFGLHTIKYFNGGLFDSSSVIDLDKTDLGILHEVATKYDWSHVAPAIFGTLFERSLDDKRRSLIGAHYTSEDDILLIIDPVVIAPLRNRWERIRESVLISLESSRNGKNSTLLTSDPHAEELLAKWFDELGQVRVLDPACGSGNFLYVALRKLLDLWLEARDFAIHHNIQLAIQYAADHIPSPTQLFGIEVEDYAHQLASVVVWIGFLQWKIEHGMLIDKQPILEKLSNIEHADAILRYDASGKPYEPTWPPAHFIVGNPPFLGGKLLRRELGDEYVDQLFALYKDRVKAESDLVVYWFEKARAQIAGDNVNRVGLLATQAIRGGANRVVLERIQQDATIFWALSDHSWRREDAMVRVSMIAFEKNSQDVDLAAEAESVQKKRPKARNITAQGEALGADGLEAQGLKARHMADAPHLDSGMAASGEAENTPQNTRHDPTQPKGPEARPIPARGNAPGKDAERTQGLKARPMPLLLDGQPVPFINADLTTGSNTVSAHRLPENANLCFMGTTKVGPFDIDAETARKMLTAPLNPNGRPNSDVVRPWVNALDITRRPRNMYIIDFGTNMTETEAALYELPFEYVRHHVKPLRTENKRQTYANRWWIHGEAREGLRKRLKGLARYIVTPTVSKHRAFVWTEATVVPDHQVFAFPSENDFFFGVLQSSIHEAWARQQGTQLREYESGFRYTPNSCFDTFPFPYPPGTEPTEDDSPIVRAIAEAARELVRLRDAWLNPPNATEEDLKDRTLTKLYNLRAAGKCAWLENAHQTLDRAVFAAYRWPYPLPTQEILTRLLALNHQRATPPNP